MKRIYWLVAGGVVFFIVLAADLFTDLRIGDKVNHFDGAIYRSVVLLPCILFLIIYARAYNLLSILLVIAMVGINFMNLFDGLYNLFRGYGWFFTGSEDGAGDAITDNFFQSIPLWAHVLIKIGGSALTILLYKKHYEH